MNIYKIYGIKQLIDEMNSWIIFDLFKPYCGRNIITSDLASRSLALSPTCAPMHTLCLLVCSIRYKFLTYIKIDEYASAFHTGGENAKSRWGGGGVGWCANLYDPSWK